MKKETTYGMLVMFSVFSAVLMVSTAVAVPVTQSTPFREQQQKLSDAGDIEQQLCVMSAEANSKYQYIFSLKASGKITFTDVERELNTLTNRPLYKIMSNLVDKKLDPETKQIIEQKINELFSTIPKTAPTGTPQEDWDNIIQTCGEAIMKYVEIMTLFFGNNQLAWLAGAVVGLLMITPLLLGLVFMWEYNNVTYTIGQNWQELIDMFGLVGLAVMLLFILPITYLIMFPMHTLKAYAEVWKYVGDNFPW